MSGVSTAENHPPLLYRQTRAKAGVEGEKNKNQ